MTTGTGTGTGAATATAAPSPARCRSGPAGNALARSVRAEAVKLTRPRFLLSAMAAVGVLAVAGTALTVALTEPTAGPGRGAGQPLSAQDLAAAGGGIAIFTQTLAFTSVFLLAAFIATVAGEFTRGTFRTLLLQQPRRAQLLMGKLAALIGFAAAAALGGGVLSWATARLLGPGQGIDTTRWTTTAAVGAAAEGFGRALVFLAVTAVFATLVGVLARSVPVGVGIGLVWAGPIENLIGDSWAPGQRWFPVLLLRSVLSPGPTSTSTGRALVTLAVYTAVAVAAITVALRRRDVTA